VAAARHLVDAGVARADAVFVRGTSAGGTTALLSLATGTVRGAVAWYPASSFDDDEGGFEEGYLAGLLGTATAAERSPLARAGELSGRALVVQGELDEVVGLDESRRLVEALSRSLESVELLVVPGEGHGFRTTTGRAAALGAELAFYLAAIREVPGAEPGARYDATAAGSPDRHERP
ncbi:MAG TPA: prolyl oligopeptidase family serine peptidase, partial [Acidimicrobiales bacterium]|nr:prolyl oligopeptidase family serine peptidase [Acidimicrobiales bacterium]